MMFDPRTNALAAFMMNPLFYGDPAAAMAMLQASQQQSPNTHLAGLVATNSSSPTGKSHPHPFQAQNEYQLAAAAAHAASQQTHFANFAANYAVAHQQAGNQLRLQNALLSPNAGKSAAGNYSNSSLASNKSVKSGSSSSGPSVPSFRILDILESSSSSPNMLNASLLQKMAAANGVDGSSLGNQNDVSPDGLKDPLTAMIDQHRLENDSARGKKRPFTSEGEEDCDEANNDGSLSPRSGRSSPNGSLVSGTTGNGMGGSGGKKARKARTIFTDKQLQELETMFDKHKYLSVQDRMDLAQRMGLTDTQVKTWYQNRRTKWKRQAAVGVDLLQEASNLAAVQNLIRSNPYWAQYMSNPLHSTLFAQRMPPNLNNGFVAGMIGGMPPGLLNPSLGPRANSSSSNNSASPSSTPTGARVESSGNGEESDPNSPNFLKNSISEEQQQQLLLLAAAAGAHRQQKVVGEKEQEEGVPNGGSLLFSPQQLFNGTSKSVLKDEKLDEKVTQDEITRDLKTSPNLSQELKPENQDE